MSDIENSEFRQVKARASIKLTEYTNSTVECIPKFEPPVNLTLGSHAIINTM